MADVVEIADGERIIRRIPPPLSENTKVVDGVLRPSSQRMQLLKAGDSGLSCSRLEQTSPTTLLDLLVAKGRSPEGWGICVLRVDDVRSLGFKVVHKPEGDDPGHCEIQGEFRRKSPKHLAKIARMLTESEIASGRVAID